MTTLISVPLAMLLLLGGLAGLSAALSRRIERVEPPEGGFLDLDRQRLHMLDMGAGRPVVLIHGLSGQMGNFTYGLVSRLRDDFRVVAFDRPGSGYSTRAPGAPAGIRAQAAFLARAIRAMKLGDAVIVGHSLGGAIALALALDHPDCAAALALISPATHPSPAIPPVFRGLALLASPLTRRFFAWTLATPLGLFARSWGTRQVFAPEPAPPDFATRGGGLLPLRPSNIEASAAELAAALLPEDIESMTQRYGSLRIPVGILFGRSDRVLDWRAQGEAMKRDLPSLDLEIVEGGHMLPVTQPEVCAAFIRRMAAKVPVRESVLSAGSRGGLAHPSRPAR